MVVLAGPTTSPARSAQAARGGHLPGLRLHDFLDYWARQQPDVEFATQGDRGATYAHAQLAANRLANALVRAGLERGDRIAIVAKNCIEYALL